MYEIVGFRFVDMKTEDGKLQGYSCFILNNEEQSGLTGAEAIKVFFSCDKFPEFRPEVGQHYDLRFNQKGKLTGYSLIDG